jgi:hypothetical protein
LFREAKQTAVEGSLLPCRVPRFWPVLPEVGTFSRLATPYFFSALPAISFR